MKHEKKKCWILKMKMICTLETSVDFYLTAWLCIPEEKSLNADKVLGIVGRKQNNGGIEIDNEKLRLCVASHSFRKLHRECCDKEENA
jgi:hypothetical protein